MKSAILNGLSGALLSQTAIAQDYDDFDEFTMEESASTSQVVREVVRGKYAKVNVGAGLYLLNFSGWVSPGTSVGMIYGDDFVDQEGFSMAWEAGFTQGIHNGAHYRQQGDAGCQGTGGAAPCLQGDLRTYTFSVALEASTYFKRRYGLGARVGAGALYSPLLIEESAYLSEVVGGEFRGYDPGYHGSIKPIVLFGPTFEYYSKLSHFSVGLDADIFYGIGFDLGVNATGYLKYTF